MPHMYKVHKLKRAKETKNNNNNEIIEKYFINGLNDVHRT